jgi:hypothetical protein
LSAPDDGELPAVPRTPATEPSAPPLSQWLLLMLGEIARKREELERARAEEAQRSSEREAARAPPRR